MRCHNLLLLLTQVLLLLGTTCAADAITDDDDDDGGGGDDHGGRPGDGEFSNAKSVAAECAVFLERRDNAYSKPLAKLFAGREAMSSRKRRDKRIYGRNQVSGLVARHMLIDQRLHKAVTLDPHGPRQVVILGAGFDTRSSRYAYLPVERWFELDLPEPQKYKQFVLDEHRSLVGEEDRVTRIPVDLTVDDWVGALEQAGWDPTAPTVYILEGLIYYFSTEKAKALLHSVPSVPNSRLLVTTVDRSLQALFESYGMEQDLWKSNLQKLEKAGALQIPGYKLYKRSSGSFPRRNDLNVDVQPLPTRNWWESLCFFFRTPQEHIFEFIAI